MNIIPIQVTDEGVLIPKTYLRNALEVEVVATGDYFLIKPRQPAAAAQQPPAPVVSEAQASPPIAPPARAVEQPGAVRRHPLLTAASRSRNPDAATILTDEADRRRFTLREAKQGNEFDLRP